MVTMEAIIESRAGSWGRAGSVSYQARLAHRVGKDPAQFSRHRGRVVDRVRETMGPGSCVSDN